MKKFIFIFVIMLFVISCDDDNKDETKFERFMYYSIANGDSAGFYQYNFNGKNKLITKKHIVKSTQIADNGRFVFLELDPNDGGFNYYGLCEGNLLEVPKPEGNEYLLNFIGKEISDIPMQIDNVGHNFVSIIYKVVHTENEVYFRPYISNFNCEKWEMTILDLEELITAKLNTSEVKIDIYSDIIAYKEYFYAIANCENEIDSKKNYLIKFNLENFYITEIQTKDDAKLISISEDEFLHKIVLFKNNELIIEENSGSGYIVENLIDMYDFMSLSTDYKTVHFNNWILGFSETDLRALNFSTSEKAEFPAISKIYNDGNYSKESSQVCVSNGNEIFAISLQGKPSKLLIYNGLRGTINETFDNYQSKYLIWGISRETQY